MLDGENSPIGLVAEAIGTKRCIKAVYNRGKIRLAPDSLVDRHGQLYLRAVRLEFDGRLARFPRLGLFKLSGLTDMELSSNPCSASEILKAAANAQPANTLASA